MSLYRYPGVGAEDGSVARDNAVLSIGGKSSLCLVGSLLASFFFFFDDVVSSLFNKRSRGMDGAQ
jgi:hypothetical protein